MCNFDWFGGKWKENPQELIFDHEGIRAAFGFFAELSCFSPSIHSVHAHVWACLVRQSCQTPPEVEVKFECACFFSKNNHATQPSMLFHSSKANYTALPVPMWKRLEALVFHIHSK